MNKTFIRIILASIFITILFAFSAYAGEWHSENGYWQYNENGTDIKNQWRTIDGRDYLFNSEGRLLGDAGYPVNAPAGLDEGFWAETKKYALQNNSYWQTALDLVNQTRIASGLKPLVLNYDLCMAATYRCVESTHWMTWEHYIGSGYRCDTIIGPISENRIRNTLGENIAYHLASGRYASLGVDYRLHQMDGELKGCPSHLANILHAPFYAFGAGLTIMPVSGEFESSATYFQLFLD